MTPVAGREESAAALIRRTGPAEPASAPDLAVDHHRDEKKSEIKQGELVDLPRGSRPVRQHAHPDDSSQQNSTEHDRGNEVDRAERAKRYGQKREGNEDDVVPDHLLHRLALTPHQRSHWNSGVPVVALLEDRKSACRERV